MFFSNFNTSGAEKRYSMSNFMQWLDLWYDPFSSYFFYKALQIKESGYVTITEEINRADLISYAIYGETTFWWLLCMYNGKVCPFDFTVGEQIKYISSSQINDLYLTLKTASKDRSKVL